MSKLNKKNIEIERKFLIDENLLPDLTAYPYMQIMQGYLDLKDKTAVRLREVKFIPSIGKGSFTKKHFWTVKGEGFLNHKEHEVLISKPQFQTMWEPFSKLVLHKDRYGLCGINNDLVEIDFFKKDLFGLIMAEVEFETIELANAYVPEPFMIEEVTHKSEYSNYSLAKNGLPNECIV
jgi:CYTH domain-containing protein